MKKIFLTLFSFLLTANLYAALDIEDDSDEQNRTPMDYINDHLRELKVSNMDFAREKAKELRRRNNPKKQHNKKKSTKDFIKKPFALVFTDIDPECSPEIIFQQPKETLYVIRNPGLVVNDEVLAGVNQTIKLHDIDLIVVMGHTPDLLMEQACEGFHGNYAPILIGKLQAAVQAARVHLPDSQCNTPQMNNILAKQNMMMSIAKIVKNSPEIEKRIRMKRLKIIGAIMNHSTNQAEFFDSVEV